MTVFRNFALRFTFKFAPSFFCHFYSESELLFFTTLQPPILLEFLTHFGQKIDFKAICWLHKGKTNFEKVRGKQDFLMALGFGYNFPQLAYGNPWVKYFCSLRRQNLNKYG
jgi:hypothetical protein